MWNRNGICFAVVLGRITMTANAERMTALILVGAAILLVAAMLAALV
jgi:hypothetical protein